MDTELSDYYAMRDHLVDNLIKNLVGPDSEYEEINELPNNRYITGILYPVGANKPDAIQDSGEENETGDEISYSDSPVSYANTMFPSSLGMTFSLIKGVKMFSIEVRCARYEVADKKKDERDAWQRVPLRPEVIKIDIGECPKNRIDLSENGVKIPGLQLYYTTHVYEEGPISITVVLLNKNIIQKNYASSVERASKSFFQCGLEVRSDSNTEVFADLKKNSVVKSDEDLKSYDLLYRHVGEFAVGHGCAVSWDTKFNSKIIDRIRTDCVPQFAFKLHDNNPSIDTLRLSFKFLSTASRDGIILSLSELCDEYAQWIEGISSEIHSLEINRGCHSLTAEAHISACKDSLSRMREGIQLISDNDQCLESFRLMNRSMLIQQSRSKWIRDNYLGDEPIEDDSFRWYPFQIAFILMCLKGIAEPNSTDRDIVDLLWFPTGGGKTEAYLGLIAFNIILRRLEGRGGGVTAIMRYTLRLLTVQQFQRAASLICALESIRIIDDRLGEDRISLGLWVGGGATPNTIEAAIGAMDKIYNGGQVESTPIQLQACPWCGRILDPQNDYIVMEKPRRLVISCNNDRCLFRRTDDSNSDGIPAYVVDDDIYRMRPSLIISTVDKFSQIPWSEKVLSVFNIPPGRGKKEWYPPELIVQDELHLISGPLGSMVGLYESAVNSICTINGKGPKIVASTATIRRAVNQVTAVYAKKVKQFPSPGLDARDSFFAQEAPSDKKGTRLYIGLMAPGKSHATLMIRTYATLLQSVFEASGYSDAVKDPYWTLVGYFNSLRLLGAAEINIDDDVADRIKQIASDNSKGDLSLKIKEFRKIQKKIALFSNVPSGEIPTYLKDLEIEFSSSPGKKIPVDVVSATNMISVGVDINRLGLMALMGQPPLTAEYIQATSRVGRKKPGLVVVMYNPTKSRDRSHYESFTTYHAGIYMQVEGNSATPFSARARDRGLHAIIVAIARAKIPGLRKDEDVANVGNYLKEINEIINEIMNRIAVVSPDEVDEARSEAEKFVRYWVNLASAENVGKNKMVYENRSKVENKIALLKMADAETSIENGIPTMNSMRDVDSESNVYLLNRRF